MISILLNAHQYYLKRVLILHTNNHFRLLVTHLDSVLVDKKYSTLKGAKIAFHKFYRHQACNEEIVPSWSEYDPDENWLKTELAMLNNSS